MVAMNGQNSRRAAGGAGAAWTVRSGAAWLCPRALSGTGPTVTDCRDWMQRRNNVLQVSYHRAIRLDRVHRESNRRAPCVKPHAGMRNLLLRKAADL
jgi:hypothetical protein